MASCTANFYHEKRELFVRKSLEELEVGHSTRPEKKAAGLARSERLEVRGRKDAAYELGLDGQCEMKNASPGGWRSRKSVV